MKLYLIAIALFVCEITFSQTTFTKLIDLNNGFENYLLDFEMDDNFMFASSKHFCPLDTSNQNLITCTGLSKFDLNGNLIQKILLDSFYPEGLNRLIIHEDRLLLSGHFHESFTGRPTAILEYDLNFNLDSTYIYSNNPNSIVNNEGVFEYNGNFFLYGTELVHNESKQYSNILKINAKGETIWNRKYSRGLWINEIYDLQNTSDGKLIFFQYFNDGVGSGGESGLQIVKIDTNGVVLDTFEFEDISIDNPRLLSASDGNVYFSSQDPPFPHTIPSNGRINKIDYQLDSIKWSSALPANPFIDGHRFKVYDYLELPGNEIIVCGTVWEEGPDGPIGTPDDHTWNGFIAKYSTTGLLIWLRIYRHPNVHPLLQVDDFGNYRPSYLNKIYPAAGNRFIVAGSVYYDAYQDAALPAKENKSSIWLLMVNDLGCLENEECTQNIVLDGSNSQMPKFQIGTSWIYEVEEYPFPIYFSYQTFTITDTTLKSGKEVFIIENDFDNTIEFMYEEENKVYFWDDKADSFNLHYDFDQLNQYSSGWSGSCGSQNSGVAAINIDSISNYILNNDTITIQNISISNNGSTEDEIKTGVYNDIGLKEFGIKLPLGLALCDFNRAITKLRCFDDGNISYQFVDYPCDSTWFTTSNTSIENSKIVIYPNPTNGIIYFNNEYVGSSYRLNSIRGDLIDSGILRSNFLSFPHPGIFHLQIFNSNLSRSAIIIVND